MRFLIASLLTPSSDQLIRQTYLDVFGQPCRIRTLHLTFIPPFITSEANFTHIAESLTTLTPLPEIITPQSLNLFNHARKILYLPLTPVEPLAEIYHHLLDRVQPLVNFLSTDFAPNEIPAFLPHLTLNYDFPDRPLPLAAFPAIILQPPALLWEAGPGIWQLAETFPHDD